MFYTALAYCAITTPSSSAAKLTCGAWHNLRRPAIEFWKSSGTMNIQNYYQAIRSQEATILSEFTWVTSLDTRNGGVGGRVSEVPRALAAKLVVDGMARISTREEAEAEGKRIMSSRRRNITPIELNYVTADNDRGAKRSSE